MSLRTLVLATENIEIFPDESTFGDGVFVDFADIASGAGVVRFTGIEAEPDPWQDIRMEDGVTTQSDTLDDSVVSILGVEMVVFGNHRFLHNAYYFISCFW